MKTRCRPGDLAVITSSKNPVNIGRVIEVGDRVICPFDPAEPTFEVKAIGRPLVSASGRETVEFGFDKCMRPIAGPSIQTRLKRARAA